MQLERLTSADVSRLGGPAGLASHLRSLVPPADSVREAVREIVEAVRMREDEAVLEYTRHFDTAGGEPRALTVGGAELDEAPGLIPHEMARREFLFIPTVDRIA